MTKKKIIIIASIALALIAAGVLLYFFVFKGEKDKSNNKPSNTKTEKITINFDTDGGEEIEDVKIEKGTSTVLPTATKEGFILSGWYLDDEKITDEYIFEKDVTLKAKWEELEEEEKVMTVTFDSKGGSKVSSMSFKCVDGAATIKNLPKPKKDAYEFLSWEDKFGKSILDGAKITCTDELKLYAVWEYDGPTANTDPNANKEYFTVSFNSNGGNSVSPVKVKCGKALSLPTNPTRKDYNFDKWIDQNETPILEGAVLACEDTTLYAVWIKTTKEYTCEYGYELKDGNKCVKTTSATPTCSAGMTYSEKAKKCYKLVNFASSQSECQEGQEFKTSSDLANAVSPGCYIIENATRKCPDGYINTTVWGECAIVKNVE